MDETDPASIKIKIKKEIDLFQPSAGNLSHHNNNNNKGSLMIMLMKILKSKVHFCLFARILKILVREWGFCGYFTNAQVQCNILKIKILRIVCLDQF